MTDDNYNRFFEEDESTSSGSITTTNPANSTSKDGPLDNGKCGCIDLLKLLLKKTDAIEDHLIKIDVKIDHFDSTPSNTRQVAKLRSVNLDELRQFGLPADTEDRLQNLEKKLKDDSEFKNKLVS